VGSSPPAPLVVLVNRYDCALVLLDFDIAG